MKNKGFSKKLKQLGQIISVIGLTACSSIEIVHVPLDCLGVPDIPSHLKFSDKEADLVNDFALDKFEAISIILRARIDAQCEQISRHNIVHKGS